MSDMRTGDDDDMTGNDAPDELTFDETDTLSDGKADDDLDEGSAATDLDDDDANA